MIGILNYGSGNIKSLSNALDNIEENHLIVDNFNSLKKLSKLIIPGVGSYFDAMQKLRKKRLINEIREFSEKKFILGICVGMQILSDNGYEDRYTNGLKIINGSVKRIYQNKKISHVGWNNIKIKRDSILFKNLIEGCDFYFVHSYHLDNTNKNNITSFSLFNEKKIVSSVQKKNIFGVQFHPEKSHKNGLRILKNFCKI